MNEIQLIILALAVLVSYAAGYWQAREDQKEKKGSKNDYKKANQK